MDLPPAHCTDAICGGVLPSSHAVEMKIIKHLQPITQGGFGV